MSVLQQIITRSPSGEASPTIWSCYANIFVFTDCKDNQFLKKWIMIMIWNLHSMTKSSGWLRHCAHLRWFGRRFNTNLLICNWLLQHYWSLWRALWGYKCTSSRNEKVNTARSEAEWGQMNPDKARTTSAISVLIFNLTKTNSCTTITHGTVTWFKSTNKNVSFREVNVNISYTQFWHYLRAYTTVSTFPVELFKTLGDENFWKVDYHNNCLLDILK